MPVELGLAAFDASVTSAELLIWIIKTVQKVRHLKKKCREVGEIAKIVQTVIEADKDVLESHKTRPGLDKILKEVAAFVLQCTTKFNIAQRAWEVLWVRRLPSLMNTMKDWTLNSIMENSVPGFYPIFRCRWL
jgi:hypothetical protein